ncbi:MAG: hypothetical protein AB8C46_13210 [Burkholderiaceae bacterium]
MNTNLNSTSQFSNDADVFAYRGQAARLRSEEVRKLFARFTAWFGAAKANAANNTGRQVECEAC